MAVKIAPREWKGMHNGTVAGKSFEGSKRARKSHAQRKRDIADKDRSKK